MLPRVSGKIEKQEGIQHASDYNAIAYLQRDEGLSERLHSHKVRCHYDG